MADFQFRQGYSYAAGIDKPAIISASTIVEAVTDMGFRVLFADECERMPKFPFAVSGKCGDEWDWVGYAERIGPTEIIDVPGRVKWIQEIPKPASAPLPGQPQPPPEPMPPSWTNPDPPDAGLPETAKTGVAQAKSSIWGPIIIGSLAGYILARWLS